MPLKTELKKFRIYECSFHDAFCFVLLLLRIKCLSTAVREHIGHYNDNDVFERLLSDVHWPIPWTVGVDDDDRNTNDK